MSALSKAQRAKGENFIDQANKTLSKSTWFASSTEQKYEDAAELFEKAANAFKVGSMFDEAGNAYMKASELYQGKLKNINEASKCMSNAGSCFKDSSPTDAVAAYQSAVTLYCDAGRLTQAAKLSKEVGALFEKEDGQENVEASISSYRQAAELFQMEGSKSQASQCLAKVAELCSAASEPPDLTEAARIYDELGTECLDSNLLKYNAKGYFLQSVLCHLAAGDAVAASQALSRFGTLDYTFADSRESEFCSRLVSSVEDLDSDGLATACYEFDRISKLDPWKTTMLVKVKRSIGEQTGDDGIGHIGEDDEVDLT